MTGFAFLAYSVLGGILIALEPGFVVGTGFLFVLAAFAAVWLFLGLEEFRGHHAQNAIGSILSCFFAAAFSAIGLLNPDGPVEITAELPLVLLVVTGVLALLDLRLDNDRRAFPAVLSADAAILVLFGATLYLGESVIGTAEIPMQLQVAIALSVVGGSLMLALGLLRIFRVAKSLNHM